MMVVDGCVGIVELEAIRVEDTAKYNPTRDRDARIQLPLPIEGEGWGEGERKTGRGLRFGGWSPSACCAHPTGT